MYCVREIARSTVSIGNILGARLGPYEILAPLGAGDMGEVYSARDGRLGRDVAVKILPRAIAPTPEELLRFERDARAAAALDHPNILALHDVGDAGGVVYVVTELLEGETLRERLRAGGPLPARKALDYAVQIARGLAAAHDRGIVHRDLKPENLFITRDGGVKILDFGLAVQDPASVSDSETTSVSDSETTGVRVATQPGTIVGTPGYMSPEQAVGQQATARSDLFAFGLILHEMLTGSHPFTRDTVTEAFTAILRDDPPSLTRTAGVAPEVARIVVQCLEKRAEDRFGSARDLAFFLEAFGRDEETPAAAADASSPEVRRLRARLVILPCGLLLLLATAMWGYVRLMADRAVNAAMDADLAGANRIVERVNAERLTRLSLTARLIASFPEVKALFATDTGTIRDFLLSYQQRNPGTPLLVALAPDGQVLARTDDIAASSKDSEQWLAVVPAQSGEAAIVTVGGQPYHAAAAVSEAGGTPLGRIIAAAPADDTFAQTLSEATHDEVVLLTDGGITASTLRAGQTPWRSLQEWRGKGGSADRSTPLRIGVQRFAAREVALVNDPPFSAVIVKSRDEEAEPYQRIEYGLIVIGALCVLVALIGAVAFTKSISAALGAAHRS
jgi:hypothetical protein